MPQYYLHLLSSLVAFWAAFSIASAGPAEDQFGFAEGLFIQKDYESAIEEYDAYLKSYPAGDKVATARYRRAECYFRMGKEKEAAAEYTAALAAHGKASDADLGQYNLGRCHMALKDYAKAVAAFRAAAASTRQDIREEAGVGLGECLLQLKQYAAAIEHCVAFLEQYPESKYRADVLFSLGWARVEHKQPAAAVAPLRELIDKHADYADRSKAVLLLGDALTATEAYADAEAVLTPLTKDADAGADALLRLAWTRYSAGRHADAASTFLSYADTYKESGMAPSALYNAAIAYYESKAYAPACEVLARLLKQHGNSGEALNGRFWLGMAQSELGRHADTIATLEPLLRSKELAQDLRATALYTYAQSLSSVKRGKDAVQWFRVLIQELPDSKSAMDARYALGVELARLDDVQAAVNALQECLQKEPEAELGTRVRFALGEYLYRLGKLDEAKKHLAGLLAGDNTDPRVMYRLGWIAFDRKDFDQAMKAFSQLAVRESNFKSEASYMVGRAHEENNRTKEAIAAYESHLAVGAKDEFIEKSYYRLGLLYEPAKAVSHLKGYATKFPQGAFRAEVAVKLAEHQFDLGAVDEALGTYRGALSAKPSKALTATIRYGLGWCYFKQEKLDEADSEFATLGDVPGVSEMAADAILQRGEIAYQKKDYARAAAFFEKLVKDSSERGERAIYMTAWCRHHAGAIEVAAKHFEDVTKRFPDGRYALDASMRLAQHHLDRGEAAQADAVLRARVDRDGDNASEDLLLQHAEALTELGKWDELIVVCERIEKRYPDSPRRFLVSFRTGLARKELGMFEAARTHFQDTMRRTDTVEAARAQFNIATTYYSEKKYLDAAKQFLRVELLYDYEELSAKALYYAVESFVRAEGKQSRRATIYVDKLRNNYANSEWTTKALNVLKGAES